MNKAAFVTHLINPTSCFLGRFYNLELSFGSCLFQSGLFVWGIIVAQVNLFGSFLGNITRGKTIKLLQYNKKKYTQRLEMEKLNLL